MERIKFRQKMSEKSSESNSRDFLADLEFSKYNFGEGVSVSGSGSWDTDDKDDYIKVVYVNFDGDDRDSEKVSFHVRFKEDGSVSETYGLLAKTGDFIGFRESETEVERPRG
jgi:hypothetical protein